MTDKKDENEATVKIEDVKSTLQELFGESADIEVISVADVKEKEMSKMDMITKALQTVDHESTNKLIDDLTEVLHNSEGISVIEFGVVLSILCEIISEGLDDVPPIAIAQLVMSLTHASHVMKQKDKEETTLQ